MESPRRFIVIQVGARMHYAVPALLARAGMLERFYTDVHAADWPVRLGFSWWPDRLWPKALHRLSGRRLPREIVPLKVRSIPIRSLWDKLWSRGPESALLDLVQQDGFGAATDLYTLNTAHYPLCIQAKLDGLAVTYEQICHPSIGWTLYEERELYPGIEQQDSRDEIEHGIQKDISQWRCSDTVIAASDFVKDGIRTLAGCDDHVKVVPYGIPDEWLTLESTPVPGSVLCVGRLGLPKGTHYLAAATRELQARRVPIRVTAIGAGRKRIADHSLFKGPDYLDSVPRVDIVKYFQTADVFVLPTLSDSFALVHLEALACGVPVITTPNCGSVVRNGIDGFIVPIRNAEALSEKIEMIVSDRALRERMSRNARERAREFTWARYGERLLSAISTSTPRGSAEVHV